jgi:hypothetical protein
MMPKLPKLRSLLPGEKVLPPLAARRRPITTWKRFLEAHDEDQTRIARYIEADRRGERYARLPPFIHEELEEKSRIYLFANNRFARVDFARIVRRHCKRLFAAKDGELFIWITFAPGRFTFIEATIDFDTRRLQAWVRQLMPGLNFIGMVEPARYNFRKILGFRNVRISWHAHLVCWGDVKVLRRVKLICNKVNKRSPSFIRSIPSAYNAVVPKEKILGKVLYMLKSPQDEYRAFVSRAAKLNVNSGRYVRGADGLYKQKSRALRPGDRLRMCHVLANQRLAELLFAGGPEGKLLLSKIRKRAFKPMHDLESGARSMTRVGPYVSTWLDAERRNARYARSRRREM